MPFVESSAIIVANESPYRTLAEFMAACREGPVIGSGGPDFSVWKFSLLGLLHAAGMDPKKAQWIETYSGEQGLANVLEGAAMVAPITMTDARKFLRAGEARALATMEDRRHAAFPEVPTVKEAIGIDWSAVSYTHLTLPTKRIV